MMRSFPIFLNDLAIERQRHSAGEPVFSSHLIHPPVQVLTMLGHGPGCVFVCPGAVPDIEMVIAVPAGFDRIKIQRRN